MATVIDMPSPLATGRSAADSLIGGYNDAKAKAVALARQKMLDDKADAKDKLAESHWQTEEGDRQSAATAAAAQIKFENDRQTRIDAINAQAAKDTHTINNEAAYERTRLWPHVVKATVMAEKFAAGQATQQAATLAATLASTKTTELDNDIKRRFAAAEAQSIINQRNAQITEALSAARRNDAGTGLDNAEAANLRAGRTRAGGNPLGRETYTGDLDKMSPAAQAFAQKLQAAVGDNRLTMGGALNAIAQAKGLSDTDKHLLRSSLGTPEGRMAMTQTDAAQTTAMAPKALALKATKLFPKSGVPTEIQDFTIEQLSKGVSIDAIADSIRTAKRSEKNGGGLRYDAATQQNAFKILRQLDPNALPEPAAPTPAAGGVDWGGMFSKLLQGLPHVDPNAAANR